MGLWQGDGWQDFLRNRVFAGWKPGFLPEGDGGGSVSPIGAVRYESASGRGGDLGERDGGCGRIGADHSQGGRKDGQEVIFEN